MGEKGKEREIECERREEKCGNFYGNGRRKKSEKLQRNKTKKNFGVRFFHAFSDNFLCAPNVQQTRKTEENFMSFQYTSIASLFLQFMPEKKVNIPETTQLLCVCGRSGTYEILCTQFFLLMDALCSP